MKQYEVTVHITMSATIMVEAENEEQAETKARNYAGDAHWYYVKDEHDAHCEDIEVVETQECGEAVEDDGMAGALEYVREQLEQDEIDEIRAQIDRSYRYQMSPSYCVTNHAKVIDLLEEYGEDNDLPEGWWENEGDIDDWLLKL